MDFWAGELGNNSVPGIIHGKVMDSVYNYLKLDEPKINYAYKSLFLDNGAFSIFKNNYNQKKKQIEIKIDSIIDIQERLQPDLTVPFDYPLDPDMGVKIMEKNWLKTVKNIEYWDNSTNLNIIPALHGWSKTSLTKNFQFLQKKDFNYIALGSAFILRERFKGFFGDRQPNKNIFEAFLFLVALGKEMDIDVHLFGLCASPLMYHIAAYCEIKSSDSSGYRRKAAYGKIVLPETGERYAGNGKAKFGVNWKKGLIFNNLFSEDEKQKLKECKCKACKRISKHSYRRWRHLCSDWTLRANHNKWVMEQEEIKSKELIAQGWDVYENFIDKMLERSQLRFLWSFIKQTKVKYF